MVVTLDAFEAEQLLLSTIDIDVIDVRDHEDWVDGHIPAARVVPLDVLRADTAREVDPNRAVMFVCQRGVRSLAAAKLAERLGYERIYNLDGGTAAWESAGLPLATGTNVGVRAA